MPKQLNYNQKFKKEWLKECFCKEWLLEVPHDVTKAYCKFF